MTVRRILLAAGLGVGMFGAAWGLVGCGEEPVTLFDPRMIQETERADAAQSRNPQLVALPTTRQAPNFNNLNGSTRDPTALAEFDADPIVRMSLREIIHRAVINNHDVRVAGYQPGIEGSRTVEAQAHFDPTFYTNASWQMKDEVTGGQVFNNFAGGLVPVTSNTAESQVGSGEVGIQQNLDSGGQVQLAYDNTYNWFSPATQELNPFYTSSLTLQLTQPLLRNYGYAVNQAQIVVSRLTQRESILEFRKAVEENAMDIEKAYWQLVQAEQDIRSEEELVAQTETTYTILNTRMQQGLDVSELQVAQAQTVLESRKGQLVEFKAHARDLSDQIKALMSDPEYPVSSAVVILPMDTPVESPMNFDMDDEIDTALGNRFELGEQQLKVEAATVTVTVAQNNLLPELDFVGLVGPQGGGSNEASALGTNVELHHFDGTIGFKLQVPIGNREARAIYRRTLLQRLQAIEQYQSVIEQVVLDVKTSARNVETTWILVGANRKARYSAEDALKAINEREEANEPLTPVFVQLKLDTQERLSSAQQAESESIANYNIALAQLERAKGTLLKYNNVLLEQEPDEQTDPAGLLH
ncbi:MAG: TolC family protein [Tepidisphaeraceae bacterium]|jgi:outer membrane protein TolC